MSLCHRRSRRQRAAQANHSKALAVAPRPAFSQSAKAIASTPTKRKPLSSFNSISCKNALIRPNATAEALRKAQNRLEMALAHGHAPQTSSNYGYAVNRYLKFASSIGFGEKEALPASEELVLLFICDGLGRTGPGTAKNNLSALRAWHVKRRLPWKRPECMGLINKALTEFWPRDAKKRESRPPVRSSMVTMLASAWSKGNPRQLCALAIALAAWCGQCRLGELLPPDQSFLDPKRIPRRSAWSGPRDEGRTSEIDLPWTKTTRFEGATVFLLDQRSPLNATKAISNHFRASSLKRNNFLCEYVTKGQVSFLCKEDFMTMCNDVWSLQGLPRITGHSFRIGGTTALLCSGVSPEIVKKMGRWSSDAFLIYWRSLGHLFSQHAANLKWND